MTTPHEVHTDDLARSLRYVYKGPADTFTAPFEWTFLQWGVAIGAFAAQWTLIGLLGLPFLTFTTIAGLIAIVLACIPILAFAVFLAGPITNRAVHPDTGLAYHVRTLLCEITAARPTLAAITRVYALRATTRKRHTS